MEKWIIEAIKVNDSDALLKRGADNYMEGNYKEAVEYYRLSSSMGNSQATSNLGYCYLYGRGIEINEELAFYYFQISESSCIDSVYKIGNMYEDGIYVKKDLEMCDYYYNKAVGIVINNKFEPTEFPSLFYHVAKREIAKKGNDYEIFHFLNIAYIGYNELICQGCSYYENDLKEAEKLLEKPVYKRIAVELKNQEDCSCDEY